MQKHFVEFASPGTFVPESSIVEIEAWDPKLAWQMAKDVIERHGAKPFGFHFLTRERREDELNSRIVKRSTFYWLGGKIRTREEVEADNLPNEETLRWNMRTNNIKALVVNENYWTYTGALGDDDTILTSPFKDAEYGQLFP